MTDTTRSDVLTASFALSNALYAMLGRAFEPDAKQFILGHKLRLEAANQAFAAAPAAGDHSATYAPIVASLATAATTVGRTDPNLSPDLNAAIAQCDAGVVALQRGTRPATPPGRAGLRGSLRIDGPADPMAIGAASVEGHANHSVTAPFLSQLTKLFPAEAVSIYPAGVALLAAAGVSTWWFALACVAAIAWLRGIATQPVGGGRPQYGSVAISIVSFLLWVVMLGDWFLPIAPPSETTRAAAAAAALIWTWIAPQLVSRFNIAA